MGVQHRGHRWGRTVAKVKGHSGREGREGCAPVRARNADLGDVEDRVRCAYPMMRSIRWASDLETSERGLGFLEKMWAHRKIRCVPPCQGVVYVCRLAGIVDEEITW